jgi:Protein of unknown function (DUF3037)
VKEKLQFTAWLLKYVPNPMSEASIVIGILAENEGGTFVDARFSDDWENVVVMDAHADIEYLDAFRREVQVAWRNTTERKRLLKLMEGSFSNTITISSPVAFITAEPQLEFDNFAKVNLQKSA